MNKNRCVVVALQVVATLFLLSNSAYGKVIDRYQTATAVKDLVADMQSKIIPSELKNSLLEKARKEDRAFVKDMIVHWTPYTNGNIHSEFDSLVVTGDAAKERLRIQLLDQEKQVYRINGQVWRMPGTGSIEKSLRRFFEETKLGFHRDMKEKSIFAAILSPAAAFAAGATPTNEYVVLGMLYLTKTASGQKILRTQEAAANASDYLVKSVLNKYLGTSVKVQCDGITARGEMLIDGHKIGFQSKAPALLMLTTDNPIKSKLLVQAKVRLSEGYVIVDEEMRTVACLDDACSKTSADGKHETPLPWLVHEKPVSESENQLAELKAKQALAAIRPLGACCLEDECRKSLSEKNVELHPTRSGGGGISQ